MDTNLISKQIKAVAKTYTDQEFCLPLTETEEHELVQRILKRITEHKQMDLRDIIHDTVYSFFTGQDDE
ncbi:YqzH family protein [Alkalihalobacillus deserti]|uniref:YqzH family protein n=1 Tax=Alkalihalobacillus deserti TaxID=2879466 RepID=UPI001D13707D